MTCSEDILLPPPSPPPPPQPPCPFKVGDYTEEKGKGKEGWSVHTLQSSPSSLLISPSSSSSSRSSFHSLSVLFRHCQLGKAPPLFTCEGACSPLNLFKADCRDPECVVLTMSTVREPKDEDEWHHWLLEASEAELFKQYSSIMS